MTDLSLSQSIDHRQPEDGGPGIAPAYPDPTSNSGRPFWSAAETDLLRQHYVALGPYALAAYLPARTPQAIIERARHMRLRRQAPHPQIPSSPDLDRAIRQLYAKGLPARGMQRQFCARWRRNRQWVRNQAIRLGVCMPRRSGPWRPEELAILVAQEGKGTRYAQKALAAAGYSRSEPAIGERMRSLGLEIKDKTEYMTANDVARLIGADNHVVMNWIKAGALKAKQDNVALNGTTVAWRITRKAMREFMIRYPGEWYPGRCDRYWLVEILAGKVG